MATPAQQLNEADDEFFYTDPQGAGSSTGETSDGNSTSRNVRGYSRKIELDRYVHAHGRISIEINPELMKPVGPHATKFSLAIGTTVRESFPVRCATFEAVPKEVIDLAKATLLNHFSFDLSKPEVIKFIERQMQTTFKEYRADLHRHYKKQGTHERALANPPSRLKNSIEDWHHLCNRFEDHGWQEKSKSSQKSRSALAFNHSCGSKTFISIQHNAKEKEGRDIGPVDLFELTHAKHGKWVNQAAEDAHTKMLQLQEASTQLDVSEQLPEAEICETVLGRRPCHIKGLGWGPKPPKSSRRSCSSSSNSSSSQREVETVMEITALKAQLAEANDKLARVEEKIDERIDATREETRAEMTTILNAQLEQHRAEMQEMFKKFMESQGGPSK